MKSVIVTADDFGLSVEVNEAIELAHREGILTAASLMVSGPAVADAVRRARAMPGLNVGLHLVLVDGVPALPPQRITRLVGADGRLRPDMVALALQLAVDPTARRQLRAEIDEQFRLFRATGLKLDHVNAHKHFHVHPVVAGPVLAAAAAAGAKALRVPIEPVRLLRSVAPAALGFEPAVTVAMARLLRRRARRAGFTTADRVLGLRWTGAMTEARLTGLLRNLPDGLTEIYVHPAVADGFAGSAGGYRYGDELRALLSPKCADILGETGVVSGSYGASIGTAPEVAA